MSLSGLPIELIDAIARQLEAGKERIDVTTRERDTDRDVGALVRVNRRFHNLLNPYLYRRNRKADLSYHGDALFWASAHGRVETFLRAESLGIPIPAPTHIAEAAIYDSLKVVEHLFPRVCHEDGPPDLGHPSALILALENGNLDIFRFFVARGANLEARGIRGETALHVAVRGGNIPAAALLLENGADIEAADNYGRTALHSACHDREVDAVGFLLERGADVEATDGGLDTPLHLAAERGCLEAVDMLLGKGAWHSPENEYGWTPALAAVESRKRIADAIVRSLHQAGAD